MTLRLLTLFLILFFLPAATAEEDSLHLTADTFKSLIKDLQQELESGKIPEQKDRDQVYDVIGGLKMCLPVIQSVIEHRGKAVVEKKAPQVPPSLPQPVSKSPENISQKQTEMPKKPTEKSVEHVQKETNTEVKPEELSPDLKDDGQQTTQIHTINRTVEEFKIIKDELVSQLNEGKIPGEDREAAYTMVGTLNLCLPIAKGAALLIEEMEKEKISQQTAVSPLKGAVNKELK